MQATPGKTIDYYLSHLKSCLARRYPDMTFQVDYVAKDKAILYYERPEVMDLVGSELSPKASDLLLDALVDGYDILLLQSQDWRTPAGKLTSPPIEEW